MKDVLEAIFDRLREPVAAELRCDPADDAVAGYILRAAIHHYEGRTGLPAARLLAAHDELEAAS